MHLVMVVVWIVVVMAVVVMMAASAPGKLRGCFAYTRMASNTIKAGGSLMEY